jgi:chromosome segregation ATPase
MSTLNEQSQQIFILKERLHRSTQDVEAMSQENTFLATESQSRAAELQESRAQLTALSEKLTKCEASEISLISQMTKLRAAKSQADTQIQSLTVAMEENALQHKREIEKMQQEYRVRSKAETELEAMREKERALVESNAKSEQVIASLQQEIAVLRLRNAELDEKLCEEAKTKQELDSITSECRQKLVCSSFIYFLTSLFFYSLFLYLFIY